MRGLSVFLAATAETIHHPTMAEQAEEFPRRLDTAERAEAGRRAAVVLYRSLAVSAQLQTLPCQVGPAVYYRRSAGLAVREARPRPAVQVEMYLSLVARAGRLAVAVLQVEQAEMSPLQQAQMVLRQVRGRFR